MSEQGEGVRRPYPRWAVRRPRLWAAMQARGYDEARVARELTQQFGEAVTARAVYSWLAGERNPSMERLKQLAKLLDCEFAHLADDPGKEPK